MSTGNHRNNDRRRKLRFPLRSVLRYRLLDSGSPDPAGTGFTLDVSSNGIGFIPDHPLPINAPVEIAMNWPVTLDNFCALQLVARGRIVRWAGASLACGVERFEFRTKARRNDKPQEEIS
jgi:hypothetical protein